MEVEPTRSTYVFVGNEYSANVSKHKNYFYQFNELTAVVKGHFLYRRGRNQININTNSERFGNLSLLQIKSDLVSVLSCNDIINEFL